MNKALLTQIAEALEATPGVGQQVPGTNVGFNMRMFRTRGRAGECETTCCIGGLAALLAGVEPTTEPVTEALGLTQNQADALYYGYNEDDGNKNIEALSTIWPQDAARVVRNLIETGKVVWVQS